MIQDEGRAVNLTPSAERLLRPEGTRRVVRVLESAAGGPVFDVLARDGDEEWPADACERDTIYIVISGEGALRRDGEEPLACAAGDVLFAPGGAACRFEGLSRGFTTWRILLGTG
ncbi:MAG TPA: cupin domain-containing protein [Falsiroseomonas sp.]|jgi:mannose-6-phosphate isomerase-like protein (cupin superfamily)|nr:cupin domain-containing protein [Falsiroseomonas sp.]